MSRSIFPIRLLVLMVVGTMTETIRAPTDYATFQAGINAFSNSDTGIDD